MREKLNRIGSTRRSFMKKSVVAAVAASHVTIFSGLVDATGSQQGSGTDWGAGEPCIMVTEPQLDADGNQIFLHCYFPDPAGECDGVCYIIDDEWPNEGQWKKKFVDCDLHTSRATSVICHALRPPTPQIA